MLDIPTRSLGFCQRVKIYTPAQFKSLQLILPLAAFFFAQPPWGSDQIISSPQILPLGKNSTSSSIAVKVLDNLTNSIFLASCPTFLTMYQSNFPPFPEYGLDLFCICQIFHLAYLSLHNLANFYFMFKMECLIT